MRIAIDAQPLYTDSRSHGLGRYVSNLIRSIANTDSRHQYVTIGIKNSFYPDPEIPNSMEKIEIDIGLNSAVVNFSDGKYEASFQSQLRQILLEKEIDIYHLTSPLMPDTIFPKELPCPLIVTIPDLIPYVLGYVHQWPADITAYYLNKINLVKRYAAKIIAISEWTKKDLLKYLDLPVQKVIYLGVDPNLVEYHTSHQDQVSKSKYIFYAGGYEQRKNLDSLITAYCKLPSNLQKTYALYLDCDIDADTKKRLNEYAQSSNVQGQVVFLSGITDSELSDLYRNAFLFVFPSIYEGFGLPPLEAMAFGIPVAASNATSIPEVVGDAALLFDPNNTDEISKKIQLGLEDEELRSELIQRGYERVSKFSWEKCASETIKVYESCIESAPIYPQISRKPRIAYLSPLNPCASGISDYSEELLGYLKEFFDIDIYVDGYLPTNEELKKNFKIYDISELENHIPEYYTIVYNMSNNPVYHMSIYHKMQQYPGITILHEYSCHPSFFHAYLVESRNETAYLDEMALNHGAKGVEEARRVIREGAPDFSNFPLNKKALLFSKGVIMHIPVLATKLEEKSNVPILGIPMGVKAKDREISNLDKKKYELRAKHGIPIDDFVISTIGFLSRLRRLDICLRVFSKLIQETKNSKYLIAGSFLDSGLREELNSVIKSLGIESNVIVSEFGKNLELCEEYIQLSDVFINLRYPSPGAASSVLSRALSFAKPVIASNIDDFAHFPDTCVWKVDPNETEETLLYHYLRRLYKSEKFRKNMQNYSLNYAKECDWSNITETMAQFIHKNANAL